MSAVLHVSWHQISKMENVICFKSVPKVGSSWQKSLICSSSGTQQQKKTAHLCNSLTFHLRIISTSVTAVQRTFSTYNTLYFHYNNICLLHLMLLFNRTKSNKASAAILQRPAMRTVGQSSNQRIFSTVVFLDGNVLCLEIALGGYTL